MNFSKNALISVCILSLLWISSSSAGSKACSDFFGSKAQFGERVSKRITSEFEPDWKSFDKALSVFSNSQRSFKDFNKLLNALSRVAGQHYTVEFDYKTSSGKLKTIKGSGQSVALLPKNLVHIVGKEMDPIPAESIRIGSLKIEPVKLDVTDDSESVSSFAKAVGYRSLKHVIRRVEWLQRDEPVEIIFQVLKAGRFGLLDSPEIQNGIDANFFSLFRSNWEVRNQFPPGSIEFDLKVLDREDYFVNRIWDHGKYTTDSIRFDEKERLKRFLANQFHAGASEEVVVWGPVPISMIKSIYLSAKDRERLLKKINKARIKAPEKKNWEDIIKIASDKNEL